MSVISLETLRDILSEAKTEHKNSLEALSVINEVWKEVLEYSEPERKKGRWISNSPVTMKCDQCGLIIKDWDWHRFKYCPNCGSVMNQKGGNSR